MAVGVRGAMSVDWIALTAGIIGSGIAILALIVMLDGDARTSQDCVVHADQTEDVTAVAPCEE